MFSGPSLKYVVLALFLMGFLTGLYAVIHIENPEFQVSLTILPLMAFFSLPLYFFTKGVRKAEEVE